MAACAAVMPAAALAETALVGPDDESTLFVAGPQDSLAACWARVLLPSLHAGLSDAGPLAVSYAGAPDGVTGTNQFDARAMPDGSQALLFPGQVALPWIAGDSRARFDLGHFLPILGLASPAVVMMRGGLGVPSRPGPVRLVCGAAPEPAHTALMALDLLEVDAVPVSGGADPMATVRAGGADAVFVHGDDVPGQIRAYLDAGLQPAFTAGLSMTHSAFPDDPRMAAVPHFLRLLPDMRRNADPAVTAWRAVAAASGMALVLALPRMSNGGAVARWRRACRSALAASNVSAMIDAQGLQLLADSETALALQVMRADAPAQLTFRRWLADRLAWRPA
jgi:hypothetical protein